MAESDDATSDKTESGDSEEVATLKNVQAIKEAFAALLPTVPEETDQGTLSYEDGETVAGSLLVHHAMRRVASQVSSAVVKENPEKHRVVLVRSLDQANASYARTLVAFRLKELGEIAAELNRDLETPPPFPGLDDATDDAPAKLIGPMGAGAVAAVAGGVVDLLISATQSNITIRESSMAVARSAIVAPVVDRLITAKLPVVIEEAIPVHEGNAVIKLFDKLLTQRNKLVSAAVWTRTKLVEGEYARLIAELSEHLKLLRGDHKDADDTTRTRLESDISSTEQRRASLQDQVSLAVYRATLAEATVASIDTFVTTVSTANADGITPLQTAVAYAELSSVDLLLYLDVATAGGGSLWKKTLGPDSALHQGGVAMPWILFRTSGDIVTAGVEAALSSHGTKPDEPLKLNEATATSIST